MTEFKAILTGETEKARKFKVVDREVWVPRSVTSRITKFAPDARGHRECIVEVEDWFAEKNNL